MASITTNDLISISQKTGIVTRESLLTIMPYKRKPTAVIPAAAVAILKEICESSREVVISKLYR